MKEQPECVEYSDGRKEWYLNGELIHPEQIVDLHLSRGTFCYYDEETDTLHFDEST